MFLNLYKSPRITIFLTFNRKVTKYIPFNLSIYTIQSLLFENFTLRTFEWRKDRETLHLSLKFSRQMSRRSYAYSCADPLHAESNPHAVSESESLFCCVLEAAEPTAVVEVGRRCICWLDRETFPWRSGVVGWLAAWCSLNELKSWARRLLLFLIGAYFGGGIIFWSN